MILTHHTPNRKLWVSWLGRCELSERLDLVSIGVHILELDARSDRRHYTRCYLSETNLSAYIWVLIEPIRGASLISPRTCTVDFPGRLQYCMNPPGQLRFYSYYSRYRSNRSPYSLLLFLLPLAICLTSVLGHQPRFPNVASES